jgi:hypothetical protein
MSQSEKNKPPAGIGSPELKSESLLILGLIANNLGQRIDSSGQAGGGCSLLRTNLTFSPVIPRKFRQFRDKQRHGPQCFKVYSDLALFRIFEAAKITGFEQVGNRQQQVCIWSGFRCGFKNSTSEIFLEQNN